MALNGNAKWLEEERSLEELMNVFEKTYPQMPRWWLQQVAEHLHEQVAARQLRMRSACGRRGQSTERERFHV